MKLFPIFRLAPMAAITTAFFLPGAALAQWAENDDSGWFVRLSGAARFNVKASITGTGSPLPAGVYDDGFVLPDNGGTASGLTWNWGYNSAGQIQDDQLVLNRLDGVPLLPARDLGIDSPQLGGEFVGGFRFTEFQIGKKLARLNFEAGYAYFSFSQSMGFNTAGTATRTADAFNLNGVVPPIAPYAGTPAGPGPLIDLNYSGHTVLSSPITGAFNGNLDGTLHELRIGTSVEMDLTRNLSLALGGGYSAIYTSLDLAYTETFTTNPGFPPVPTGTANLHQGEWHPGFYLEMRLNYQINRRVGVFIGGDFHSNNDGQVGDATHRVNVDLGGTYGAKLGVSFRF